MKGPSSERGSALIIGALTLWLIIYAIALVGEVSQAVRSKMKAQMSADTAALAGARIMANHLSTIAWINDSRALIHYHKVRQGADLVSAGTLAFMKAHLPELHDGSFGPSIQDYTVATNLPQIGVQNFVQTFIESYDAMTEPRQAPWQEAYPEYWRGGRYPEGVRQIRGQNADEQLARFQHALAMTTRVMVEKEVYDKAMENGSDLTAFFPTFAMYPEPGNHRILYIRAIDTVEDGSGERVLGWRMWNEEDGLDITARSVGEKTWMIDYQLEGREAHIVVEEDNPATNWVRVSYVEIFGEGRNEQQVLIDRENGIIITDDMRLEVEHLDDGSTRVTRTENGRTTTFRYRYENGQLLVYNTSTGDFEAPPGSTGPDGEPVESVTVNGTEVRLENLQQVRLGSAMLWRDRIQVGEFTIFFEHPVRVVSHIYGYSIRAEEDEVVVNGLSTRRADCRWRRAHWHMNDRNSDRSRHRLCEEEVDLQWKYEFLRDPSHLQEELAQGPEEPFDRFAERHGKVAATGELEGDNGWESIFNLRTGAPVLGEDGEPVYTQTRRCWHPEDLHCVYGGHTPDQWEWCTPVDGQPNGRYHGTTGVPLNCHLCSPAGRRFLDSRRRTLVVAGLKNLLSPLRLHRLEDYQGRSYARSEDARDIPLLVERLESFPTILDSVQRRPLSSADLPPLVLREDFFKFGITVGTWVSGSSNHQTAVQPPGGGTGFEHAEGIFAFAAARAGFRDPQTGEMVYSFPDGLERERWAASVDNLYLADWEATLVPLKTQIQNADLDTDGVHDSGLSFLLRQISSTAWRSSFFGRNQRNNIRVENLNLSRMELYDLLQH